MTVRHLRLSEVCDINPRLPRTHDLADDDKVSFVPMAAVDEVSGAIRSAEVRRFAEVKKGYTFFADGDVLFAKITPCMENGKAALAGGLAGGRGFGSTEFHVLRAGDQVMPEWLRYFVRRESFRRDAKRNFTGTAGQQRVPTSFLQNALIPVPPRAEQQRTVDLLNRAEGIVRLRRQAQQKAAELIPAIFVDMFGDPATNPKGWPMRSVRELVARFEGGKNLQAASEGSTDFRILKVSAVTSGEYVEAESKPTPDDYEPPSSHIVREGDMLFSRANTEQLVGATAVVRSTNGRTLLPDKLWRFVWAERVEQAFMHALFQSAHVRQELGKLSSGTSASMRNISQAKLFELRLPVPPLAQQSVFARHAEALQSIQLQQALAFEKAMATFNALLARAFLAERAAETVHEAEGAVA
jgi:type I restriction enzyme S subunit